MTKMFLMAATALSLGVSGTAHAAITIYTDQASYLAAISSPGVDEFEDISISGPTPTPLTRTAGAYSYKIATHNLDSVSPTLAYGVGSDSDHWLSTSTATDGILFAAFSGGVYGFGGFFFGTEVSGEYKLGSLLLYAEDADGQVSHMVLNATTNSFVGFVSTTGMLSVGLIAQQPESGSLWPTADTVTLGGALTNVAAVPEPATWAMMIGGFALIGGAARRRRATVAFA